MTIIPSNFYKDFESLKKLHYSFMDSFKAEDSSTFLESVKKLIPFYEHHLPLDGDMPAEYRFFWMKGLDKRITPEMAQKLYPDTYQDRLQLVNYETNSKKDEVNLRDLQGKTLMSAQNVYSFFVRRFIYIGCASSEKDFTVEKLQYMTARILCKNQKHPIDFDWDPKNLMLRSNAMTNACAAQNWKLLDKLIEQGGDISFIEVDEVITKYCFEFTNFRPVRINKCLEKMFNYSLTFHTRFTPWVNSQLSRPEASIDYCVQALPPPLESLDSPAGNYRIYSLIQEEIAPTIKKLNEEAESLQKAKECLSDFIPVKPVANIVLSYLNLAPELQYVTKYPKAPAIENPKPTKDPVEKKSAEDDVITPMQ